MPNGGGATVGLYQNGGYDEPLQMRLARSPQRSLHRPDLFPHTPAYDLFPCKYESNCEAFMPLHVEMNSDILTIAQTTVQNGDLMYDPRIDFKVDYENKKVIPLNFENIFQGVYEEYDISDGKPETMKQINDILAFADDWMDEIEVQGYSPVTGDEEIQQTKDNISR